MNDLATAEAVRLNELESVIERGQRTFLEIGEALLEIRDSRLYRETHATFEDYCRERWSMGRTYAHRNIEAARVVAMLPNGNKPVHEAHVRALLPLKDNPEKMAEAWEEASTNGNPPTAETVRRAVARHREPGKKRKPTGYDTTTTKGQQVAAKAKERIEVAVGNCNALARVAEDFKVELAVSVATPEEVEGWLEVFGEARTALTRLKKRIEEAR